MTHRSRRFNRGETRDSRRGSFHRNDIVNQPKSLFHGDPKFAKKGDIVKLKSGKELRITGNYSHVKYINGEPKITESKNTLIGKDSSGVLHRVERHEIHGVL